MKLFQSLLVAPAALGLLAPIAVRSAEFNLGDISRYSNDSVENISNFSELYPSDWSYKALRELVVSRNCSNLIPSGSISRFEAASIINSCLKDFAQITVQERRLIDEFNSELALVRSRVDGLDARLNEVEAGSFSSTTVASFSADFAIGAVNGKTVTVPGGTSTVLAASTSGGDAAGNLNGENVVVQSTSTSPSYSEALGNAYVYQMNLNTSFTGDDNLYVRLKAGNGWTSFGEKPGTYLNETKGTGNVLNVDKIWYTFPLGEKVEATVGPLIENYYMLAASPSVYQPKVLKAFRFGGHGIAFGASTSTGLGLKYTADNGFASSITVNSKNADDKGGFLTNQDTNKLNVMAAYTSDNYHLSATYTSQHGNFGAFNYFSTNAVKGSTDLSGYALRAWFRPDETGTAVPSVSVGFDVADFNTPASSGGFQNGNGYSIAFNWQDMFQADDVIGIAFGQPIKGTDNTTAGKNDVDPFLWEAYYSFRPNDSIEVTPGIFGGTDIKSDNKDDIFGAILQTTFKF